jgi:hypothetical protein
MNPAEHRASGPHIARKRSQSHGFTLSKAFSRGVQSANVRMIVDDASARALCIATSRYTGLEYVIAFDMFTGEVIGQRSGERDSAGFSPATREAALDSHRKLKVIHSHPQDDPLSPTEARYLDEASTDLCCRALAKSRESRELVRDFRQATHGWLFYCCARRGFYL